MLILKKFHNIFFFVKYILHYYVDFHIERDFGEFIATSVKTTPETTPISTDTRTTEMNSSETMIVTDTTMPKADHPESSTNTNVSLIVGVLITTVAVIAILVTIIVIFFRYFRYLQHSRQVYLEKVPGN